MYEELEKVKAEIEQEMNCELTQEQFDSAFEYAARKAERNGKSPDYALLLVRDVIKENAVMDFITSVSLCL